MSARERGKRTTILVHRKELLTQASVSLARLGVDHGLVSPSYTYAAHPVEVASIQTLVRRLEGRREPDTIIVDEAHHDTATLRAILAQFPKAVVLGVTATPIRGDGRGLGKEWGGIYDDLILGPSIADLIAMRFLVAPRLYAPPLPVDLSGMRIERGDYSKKEQAFRMGRATVTGCAVAHYKRICPGVPAIIFTAGVENAVRAAQEFTAAGIRTVAVDGSMPDLERRRAIEGLASGELDALASADLIGEGVDVPACGAVIQLRRTLSKALWLQQIGRALRPAPGKECAYILDHVGNAAIQQAHPTDDHQWSLEGEERDSREEAGGAPVKLEQCDACDFVFERGPLACPDCGAPAAKLRMRVVEQVEGELGELTKDELEELRKQAQEKKRARGRSAVSVY
jgi:DNA repair protein RadD